MHLVTPVWLYMCVHLPLCAWDSWRWRSEVETCGLLLYLLHALKHCTVERQNYIFNSCELCAPFSHTEFTLLFAAVGGCMTEWAQIPFFFLHWWNMKRVFWLDRDRWPHASHCWEGLCIGDERRERPGWDLHVRRARGLSHPPNRAGSPPAHGRW